MRVAIVHDWFVTYAGSERVVEQLLNLFPQADVFSLLDFLPKNERRFLNDRAVRTSFLQGLPLARKLYPRLLPLMPLAIEQFDFTPYDLVLSSSHCVAKGVLTRPDQLHLSYVHTPMRYAWDLQHEYLAQSGLSHGLRGAAARCLLHKLRQWDMLSAARVDAFACNSHFIARRIWKTYRRKARVICPPVDVEWFSLHTAKEDFYVTASRLVPYKQVHLLVEAFGKMPDRRLVVIGDGPEMSRLRGLATPNVTLLGHQDRDVVRDYLQRARAFLFASCEDFGIVLVEAQACGTPVIAFGQGGALETVRGLDTAHPTGLFFAERNATSIVEAIGQFEAAEQRINPACCRANAQRFGVDRFNHELLDFVKRQWKDFSERTSPRHAPELEEMEADLAVARVAEESGSSERHAA